MTLADLIARLERAPQDAVVRHGFRYPHSYRGDYAQLAFEPAEFVFVRDLLAHAQGALGATYRGYKGGDFRMEATTEVKLARWGECAEDDGLSAALLEYMLTDVDDSPEARLAAVPPDGCPRHPDLHEIEVWKHECPACGWFAAHSGVVVPMLHVGHRADPGPPRAWLDAETGHVWVDCFTQSGYDYTSLDLTEAIAWLEANRARLAGRTAP